ncbi:MAG: peptide-methionine (S)-S-oxide reductase MsrA [Bacilli bacterium]
MNKIYLAGGCFWGVEKFINMLYGVIRTEVGYGQSDILNPTYEDLCQSRSDACEVVMVVYDQNIINLERLLEKFFMIIDPTSLNRQGADRGIQYRSGIYFEDLDDKIIIDNYINSIKHNYIKDIVVEVQKLQNYTKAEDYHQKYLDKNKNGYCHINFNNFSEEDFK